MEFRPFENKDLMTTRAKWEQEALDCDCFPEEVEQKLKPVQEALAANAAGSYTVLYYGVFKEGENIAAALCQLVLTDRGTVGGKWLKMLKLTLSPELETLATDGDFAAVEAAVMAYKTAVLGAFAARLDHDADTLKLYGRSDEQLKFLTLLLSFIHLEHSHELSAKKEGRWLVLKAKSNLPLE